MKSPLRILLLEDNPSDAELILAALADEGIDCDDSVRVETRADFLAAVEGDRFDLILADYSLPSFDGLSALEIARLKVPDVPFIFVSGALGEELAIDTLKNGATDYVLKHRLSRLAPAVRRATAEAEERSARQNAEKSYAEIEALFRCLFDQLTVGVAIADLDGRIIEANGALQAMFGYGATEPGEMLLTHLPLPEDDDADLSAHEELCAGKRWSYLTEERYLRRDGTVLWGRVTVSVLQGREGSLSSLLIYLIEDITGDKQQRQQLLQAQKMEVVGRLAAGVSHDFNNLLTIINGYSQQLLARLPERDPARREIEAIHGAGERGAILTQRLLAFSRQQQPQSVALDLNSVITNLEPLLLRILPENIPVKTMLDPAAGCIVADQTEIEQVVLNLVINARDAMPKGGELVIATGNSRVDGPLVDSRGLAPGDYVDLVVTDTGHGMNEATKSRIFEPFFTTKPVGHGTGLGLWMVHQIMERSRGAITVDSEVDRGTSFRICLPRAERGATADLVQLALHTGEARGGSETIMVVDDETGIRELVSNMLEPVGYRVLLVRDGAEALTTAKWEPGPIHLLITDIAMPGMGGGKLSAALAASRPETKVLYISGYSDSVIPGERAAGYLPKPFRKEALLRSVRDLLDAPPEVTILVVDDDPSVRRFLGDILRPIGYLVIEATNGNQALYQLQQTKVDLLITDLIMPDQDGLQTIPMVREQFPDVRVLAMSGGFGEQFLPVAEILGSHAILPKPFDAGRVKEMVRLLLRRNTEPDDLRRGTMAAREDSSVPSMTTSGPDRTGITSSIGAPRPAPPTGNKLKGGSRSPK